MITTIILQYHSDGLVHWLPCALGRSMEAKGRQWRHAVLNSLLLVGISQGPVWSPAFQDNNNKFPSLK